jgi:hypothetical protein
MKISVQKFQELYSISNIEANEAEKSSLLVQCYTGKNESEIEKLPIGKYNELCQKINNEFKKFAGEMSKNKPKKKIWLKNKLYFVSYDLAKPPMNAGKYVEIATFSDDVVGNLHKIMATMLTPAKLTINGLKPKAKKDHVKIANDCLQMEFATAYNCALFFYAVFSKSIQNSLIYFKSITPQDREVEQVVKNLCEVLAGSTMDTWCQNLKVSA